MGNKSEDERIQPALHSLLMGDADGLQASLIADPQVVTLKVEGNTLLEWTTQPGVAPPSPEVVDVLIDAGAELNRALNLAGCWNLPALCGQLLAAGADPAARADANITPLESAAMHSSIEAADVLVAAGLHRPGLWLAAACGLLDKVKRWVSADGSLLDDPGAYRPNWAFVFAALNNRRIVVDYLLDVGVGIDARPYRNTTALHFAIQFHRLEMVRCLLERGASAAILDDTYGSDAAGWAQACDDGSERAGTIRELVSAS